MSEPQDYSTWLGHKVEPSPDYPGRVFLARTSTGLAALEARHEDGFWAAKIRVDGFEGRAVARKREEARLEAEKRLWAALLQDPKGQAWVSALNLALKLNPSLVN
jgi:ABC-type sugar transport system substrate-binding protein